MSTGTSCDRLDVDGLENASREGLKKAIKHYDCKPNHYNQ